MTSPAVAVDTRHWPPTGPQLLRQAARLLPATGGPVAKRDIHAALVSALRELGAGRDQHHQLMLADEALDMLASLAP